MSCIVGSLAYPSLTCLREFAEKRVWLQRRGLIDTHCRHSMVFRRCVKRQQPISVIIEIVH